MLEQNRGRNLRSRLSSQRQKVAGNRGSQTVENGETEAAQRSIDVSDSVSYDVMEATTLFSRHPGSTRTIGLAWKEMKSYITFRHVTDVQI